MGSVVYNTYQNKQYSEHRINYVNLALIMLSIIFIALPLGRNIVISYPIRIIVIVLWYLSCFFDNKKAMSKISGVIVACFVIILFEYFYLFIGYSTAALGNYYNTIIYYDIIIKSFYVMFAYSLRARALLFRFMQVYLMIVCYFNGIYGNLLSRIYDEGGVLELLSEMGTTGTPTEFYNMLIFYVAANVYMLINEKKKMLKALDITAILLAFYFIFSYHTRATSLFLMALLSFLLLSNRNTKTYVKGKILGTTIVFVLFALVLFFIAGSTLNVILPERVMQRFNAVFNVFTNEINQNDLKYLGRFRLNRVSINTWLSSPRSMIFGIGNHLGRNYYNTIGQHAFYIDYLAKYGIVGISLIIISLKSFVKTSKLFALEGREHMFFAMFFVIYILLGFIAKSAFAIIASGAFLYSLLAISTIKYYNAR